MSIWFVAILVASAASLIVPIVGVARSRSGKSASSLFVLLGPILCSLSLLLIILEMSDYVSSGNLSALLDTIDSWLFISSVFMFVSLTISLTCHWLSNKTKSH